MGRWTENSAGKWSYDPHGHDDEEPPATAALPVMYPAVHTPSPRARVDPNLLPTETQHHHGGAE